MSKLLEVNDLNVTFTTNDGEVTAVQDFSFSVDKGKTLAIVGESGSGKSQSIFAITGLLAKNGRATGSALFEGQEILNIGDVALSKIRASNIAMIFQDPMTSLNPYLRVSNQMAEVLMLHKGMSKSDAVRESVRMLDAVKIPDAKARVRMYPHEFSGGMRQRVMIAMSLLCSPKLLIADEPTTALDVTVQAQIMKLLRDLQIDFGMAVILITHDLGVVAGSCDETLVMYGGQIMEEGSTEALFEKPTHPYTMGLLHAIPRLDQAGDKLSTIRGNPPNMMNMPKGCPFTARCDFGAPRCATDKPALIENGDHRRACHRRPEELV